MKERITKFLLKENISSAEFADKIGVQRSSVSHILNGRNSPSTPFIQKMLSVYKTLNPRWLLLGEDEMYLSMETKNYEPSLFSIEIREENVKPDALNEPKNLRNQDSNILNDKEFPGQKSEPEPIKSSEPHTTKEVTDNLSRMANLKDVERIVLLYKDKTFTEYTPSK